MDFEKSIRARREAQQDNLIKSFSPNLIKGKAAQEGEEREWGGKKYKKTGGKWVEVAKGKGDKKPDESKGKSPSKPDDKKDGKQASSSGDGQVDKHEIAQLTHLKSVMEKDPGKAYEIFQTLSPEAQAAVPQEVTNKLVADSHTEADNAAEGVFDDKKEDAPPTELDTSAQVQEAFNKILSDVAANNPSYGMEALQDQANKEFKKEHGKSFDDADTEAFDKEEKSKKDAKLTDADKEILSQVDEMDRDKYNKKEQAMLDRGVDVKDIQDFHVNDMDDYNKKKADKKAKEEAKPAAVKAADKAISDPTPENIKSAQSKVNARLKSLSKTLGTRKTMDEKYALEEAQQDLYGLAGDFDKMNEFDVAQLYEKEFGKYPEGMQREAVESELTGKRLKSLQKEQKKLEKKVDKLAGGTAVSSKQASNLKEAVDQLGKIQKQVKAAQKKSGGDIKKALPTLSFEQQIQANRAERQNQLIKSLQ